MGLVGRLLAFTVRTAAENFQRKIYTHVHDCQVQKREQEWRAEERRKEGCYFGDCEHACHSKKSPRHGEEKLFQHHMHTYVYDVTR